MYDKRKIVAVAFVLLAFTGRLFAGEGRIGVIIAIDWMWYSNPEDTGKWTSTFTSIPLHLLSERNMERNGRRIV